MPPNPLVARDLDVLWHPCSQMRDYRDFPPLEIVSADGVWLHLADGRRVFDAISSWWCKSLGHGHPHLRAALTAQALQFEHVILANTTNQPVVRLCERLLALANGYSCRHWDASAPPGRLPGHFGKVFFADNGSTAVEVALKLALQAQAQSGRPRRTTFAALANGYHGETVGALSVGDCGLYKNMYAPLLFPCTMLRNIPYRSGAQDSLWMDASHEWPALLAQLDAQADTLAAIIYEPILQGAGGMRLYSPDLLRRLRAWASAHDVYLIADEIAAGMGRCGAWLASHLCTSDELDGISGIDRHLPDFAILSKGLTGGFLPLATVLVTDAIYDVFDADYLTGKAFLHSNTYAGNALAVAVANAALDVCAEADVLGLVARNGPRLRESLSALANTRPYLRNVRGLGMMAAVDLTTPQGTPLEPAERMGFRVYQEAVRLGALLRPLGDTLYVFPPLIASAQEIDYLLTILADSCDAVMRI